MVIFAARVIVAGMPEHSGTTRSLRAYNAPTTPETSSFTPDVVIDIDATAIEKKIAALSCHHSSFEWLPGTPVIHEVPEGEKPQHHWTACSTVEPRCADRFPYKT